MPRSAEVLRRLLRKLRVVLEDGMRQQVTRRGVMFTLLTLLVGLSAFVSANNLLFLLLAALLSTLLLAGLISRLGLAGLELKIDLPEHMAARRPILGRVRITNSKLFIPSFSLHFSGARESGLASELYIPVIPAGAVINEPVQLEFSRRGIYRDNTFYFASEFPFGFTRRRARVQLEHEILVYPPIDGVPGVNELVSDLIGEIDSRRRGQGHDFYRIRPYDALESARHVDWRATAHTGDLQVREYAREDDQTVTVLLDLDTGGLPLAAFEFAVDCASCLVWRLSNAGLKVRLMTQHFDRQLPDETTVYAMLRYLALVSPIRGLAPPVPHDDRSMQIALSARPDTVADAGWSPHRTLNLAESAPEPGLGSGAH